MNRKTLTIAVILILATAGYLFVQKSQESSQEKRVRVAVENVLAQSSLPNPNEEMPKGIKLLSVSVEVNKVTLNFSKEILSKGQGVFEDVFSLVSNAIHPIIQGEGRDPIYPEMIIMVLIEGKSPDEVLM